jgi:hypothetical protein
MPGLHGSCIEGNGSMKSSTVMRESCGWSRKWTRPDVGCGWMLRKSSVVSESSVISCAARLMNDAIDAVCPFGTRMPFFMISASSRWRFPKL